MLRLAGAAGASPGRRVLLAAGLLGGLLLAAWAGLYLAAGPGIAKGTTVLGVPVGGLSRAEAAARLDRELGAEERVAVPVVAADRRLSVRPVRAGLSLDTDATVAAARARSWNPLHLWGAVFGDHEVAPVVAVDAPRLRAAVERLARRVDRAPVEGAVRLSRDAAVRTTRPADGRTLRRGEAADALRRGYLGRYLTGGAPVRLPVAQRPAAVSAHEVTRAAERVARPAVSGDVTVSVEGATATLTPRDVAAALTFEPDGGRLRPVLNGAALHAAVADQLAGVETAAVDATFRIRRGTPVVVPARPGREVLPGTLAEAVLPALTRSGAGRAATVPLQTSEPAVSTARAQRLGVVERVSTFTTYYPSDFPPRLQNIHRAADLLDGTLVLPGAVFSLNRTVGERTAARGFAAGYIIDNGKLEVDFGGGVSQLATTTFNAAYFAGLEIVEHHPHSFYISRYPEGREATVAWGVKDLRFRNDSGHGVFVTTSYTNSSVTVTMYGTRRYRIESVKGQRYDVKPFRVVYDPRPEGTTPGSCVASDGVPGFRVVVTRLFLHGGRQVRSEEFRTRYDPENEVRCGTRGPGG